MSSLSVVYGTRTAKIRTTPNKQIGEIVSESCGAFQLGEPAQYALFHNSSKLSNALPLRLANLPAGAKVQLKKTGAAVAELNLKIQLVGSPVPGKHSIVHKFSSNTSFRDVCKAVSRELGVQILDQGHCLRFQIVTRVVQEEEFGLTLGQVGVENNNLLRLSFNKPVKQPAKLGAPPTDKPPVDTPPTDKLAHNPPDNPPVDTPPTDKLAHNPPDNPPVDTPPTDKLAHNPPDNPPVDTPPAEEDTGMENQSEPPQPPARSKEVPKHVYIYKAPTAPIQPGEALDEDYELTVSHAQQYQNMLAQKAHETAKQKKLRLEAKKHDITNIEIRIKLPNQTTLQTNFKPTELVSDLYNQVDQCLSGKHSYELAIPYPPQTVANSSTPLLDYFSSRNLVLLKSSEPVELKPELINSAPPLNEAEDVKHDHSASTDTQEDSQVQHHSHIKNGTLPKSASSKKSSSSGEKKVPKWLKLGKK